MARVSIYVSDDLKVRMDAAGDAINWSEIARPAFVAALTNYEHQKGKTMITAIERLKASKMLYIHDEEKHGKNMGQKWAENSASYADLKRLSIIKLKDINPDDEFEIFSAVQAALDPEGKRWEEVAAIFGMNIPNYELNSQEAYAFVKGAQELFAEIEGKL